MTPLKINVVTLMLFLSSVNAFAGDVEWTRFKGEVKAINLKASTIRIQNSDGDVFDVPIDYQVKIIDKKNTLHGLADTELGSKVTLIKVISDKPADDTTGLVPYRGMDPAVDSEPKRRK